MSAQFLTTGQIATMLDCAPRTVCKFFDRGMLKGHRLPFTTDGRPGDRRISKASFDQFCRDAGIQIEFLQGQAATESPADENATTELT